MSFGVRYSPLLSMKALRASSKASRSSSLARRSRSARPAVLGVGSLARCRSLSLDLAGGDPADMHGAGVGVSRRF